jgi:hypothetical protein
MNEPELVAAYIGVLRHELKLRPGTDALLELEVRLSPADRDQRPPTRAPGIARLAKALKRLRARQAPAASLDQFAEDLRFLRVFEDDTSAWSSDAIDDLLANVIAIRAPKTQRTTQAGSAPTEAPPPVVPFRPRKPREPRGDA